MTTTKVSGVVRAPRASVYRALLDPGAVAAWRVPDGMTGEVHVLEPRVGGAIRISLTYDDASEGKSGGSSDTYHGHFAALVADRRVVEVIEFESGDSDLRGAMTMTTTLRDVPEGTLVEIRHEGLPEAVPVGDNEAGTRMALAHLASYVEAAPDRMP